MDATKRFVDEMAKTPTEEVTAVIGDLYNIEHADHPIIDARTHTMPQIEFLRLLWELATDRIDIKRLNKEIRELEEKNNTLNKKLNEYLNNDNF